MAPMPVGQNRKMIDYSTSPVENETVQEHAQSGWTGGGLAMKRRMHWAKISLGWLIIIAFGPLGCGTVLPPSNPPADDTIQEIESNDDFSRAQVINIPSGQTFHITGSLAGGDDVDVFSLGTFQAGQTFSATLTGEKAVNPDNVQFGFFDQDQEVAILDDNAITATDQSISFTVRKPGTYYLALAEFDLSPSSSYDYSLAVTIGSAAVTTPPTQIVYLNFSGASTVTVGGITFNNVLPFSVIDNGMDPQALAAQTVARVRTDFAPYNMQILSSYETIEPSATHSTVYISASSNPSFYGLSEDVDWYNRDSADDAIIFAGLLNGQGLTQTQFVTALANITTHEMGHLSGLAHTSDDTELMDQITPLHALDQLQTFHLAPLAEFPIGDENTPQLLQFALGLL